jgi:hypothetical protein
VTRQDVIDIMQEVLKLGTVSASRLDSKHSLEVTVEGADGEASADDNDVFGAAPLLYRPQNGAECVYMQLGDEKIVIGTRDKRWQIECDQGEVVLRAMGSAAPAYLKLSPDGTAVLKGVTLTLDPTTRTNLAGTASNQPFTNGTALHTYLDALFTAIGTDFASCAPSGGTAPGTALTAAIGASTALKTASLSTLIRGR